MAGDHFEADPSSLDAILDNRPADFSHIIRRYSHYSTPASENAASGAAAGKTVSSTPGKRGASSSATGRRLTTGSIRSTSGGLSSSSRTSRGGSGGTGSFGGRSLGGRGAVQRGGTAGPRGRAAANAKGSKSPSASDTVAAAAAAEAAEQARALAAEKVRKLEEENASLKQRLAMLEAVQSADADDMDKLGQLRIGLLKAQNMQLEQQLVVVSSSAAQLTQLKGEMTTALSDLKLKVAEFNQLEPIPPPKPVPPIEEEGAAAAGQGSARRRSTGPRSASPFSSRRDSLSPASNSPSFASSLRGQAPGKSSPVTAGRGRASSPMRGDARGRTGAKAEEEAKKAETKNVAQEPYVPRVAVAKEWLQGFEKWVEEAQSKLEGSVFKQTTLDAIGAQKELLMDVRKEAFIPGGGNRFIVQDPESETISDLTLNIARALAGNQALVDYGKVHDLEGKLGNLHPRMLTLANLMASVIFPSLPAETSSIIVQELKLAVADLFDASRALAELAVLLPAGVQLLGAGPAKAAKEMAAKHQEELDRSTDEKLGLEEEDLVKLSQNISEAKTEVPSTEEVIASLPAFKSPREQHAAKQYLHSLLQKLTHAEAVWHIEMKSLQEEMAFYRGCHAAQSSHVKQVLSAARDSLQSILGDAFLAASGAAAGLRRVLDALMSFESSPNEESLQHVTETLQEQAAVLRQFVELMPREFSAGAVVDSLLDPLEKEFKDRMQLVFDNLQSRRAAISRQRSFGGNAASRQLSPSVSANSFITPPSASISRSSSMRR